MSRVYVGHLPSRCSEREVERFFKGYGKLKDIVLKNGYGFVEFANRKDAEDAVYDLHGRDMRGERIIVEHARLPPGSRGGSRRTSGRDRRYGPPTRTEYRVVVENLSSRVSWQDLKDLMRKAGDVTFADAHKAGRNDGIVEFSSYSDMKDAIEKFDGYELYNRRLRVYEDRQNRRSRSGSLRRSRSDSRTKKRSRSRDSYRRPKSRSPRDRRQMSGSSERQRSSSRDRRDSHKRPRRDSDDAHSRSVSHRSESRHSKERSASHHSDKRSEESRSPSRNGRETAKNASERRSRSRSGSASRSHSRSRSAASQSPGRSRSASRSRSRSASHRSASGSVERRSDDEMNNSRRSEDDQEAHGHESED